MWIVESGLRGEGSAADVRSPLPAREPGGWYGECLTSRLQEFGERVCDSWTSKGIRLLPGEALLERSSPAPGELPAVPGFLVPWGAGRVPPARGDAPEPEASVVLSLCWRLSWQRAGMRCWAWGTEGMRSIPAWPLDPSCRGLRGGAALAAALWKAWALGSSSRA